MPPPNSAELQANCKGCLVGQFLNIGINKPNNISLPLSTLKNEPLSVEVDSGYCLDHKYSLYIKSLKGYANK